MLVNEGMDAREPHRSSDAGVCGHTFARHTRNPSESRGRRRREPQQQ